MSKLERPGKPSAWPLILRVGLLALVAGGGAYLAWRSGLTQELTLEKLRITLGGTGPLGVLAYFAVFALGELIYIPAIVFIGLAPALYGKALGALYALVAGVLSAAVGLAVGRLFGAGMQQRARWLERLDERLTTQGVRTVIYLRILFLLAPYLNMGLGFTRVSWRDYLLGTAIGIAPAVLLLTTIFHDVIVAGESPLSATVVVPVVVLLAMGAFAFTRKKKLLGTKTETTGETEKNESADGVSPR